MEKVIFEVSRAISPPDVLTEDRGAFKRVDIDIPSHLDFQDDESGLYVSLCSYDTEHNHEMLNQFIGKKVTVTITVSE